MNKKIILFSLLLANLKVVCGENLALPCEIKHTLEDQSTENCSQYGFTGNPLALDYHKKQKRGVIHDTKNILKRIIITEEQLNSIEDLVSSLPHNNIHTLDNPLYIIVRDGQNVLQHKIQLLRIAQHRPIDEAGYNSGTEDKKNYLAGGLVAGAFMGIAISVGFAGFLAFIIAIKKYYV